MKSILASATLAALLAVSATNAYAKPIQGNDVVVNGKVVGHDPDANIRGYMPRDTNGADY
jgi:hypothetical protein